MITCYIVDDEAYAIEILEKYIAKTPWVRLIGTSQSPLSALEIINREKPTITFLDVNMPQISGIDFADLIHSVTTIVFTTAFAGYAINAFDKNARDFLLKPFTFSRFLIAVEKFNKTESFTGPGQHQNPKSDYFFVKSGIKGKLVRINFNEITYVAGASNYVTIYLKGEEHLTYMLMKEVEKLLHFHSFFRIHKSYIVNIDKIKIIENGSVILIDKTILPIGNTYKESLFEKLNMDNTKK